MEDTIQLQVSGLVKRFGDEKVLDGIDLPSIKARLLWFWDPPAAVKAHCCDV